MLVRKPLWLQYRQEIERVEMAVIMETVIIGMERSKLIVIR